MTAAPSGAVIGAEQYAKALLRYRVMAFATGVMLLLGCILLALKDLVHLKHMEPETGLVWLAHGWLFLVYVVVTFMLGLRLRWSPVRMVLIMAAGTIPTMSFVAEHVVVKRLTADRSR
jgi:integral membrane protein